MENKPKQIESYFDAARRLFWIKNSRGEWLIVGDSAVRRELKMAGHSGFAGGEFHISPVDLELSRITRENDVAFAGALAGWRPGCHEIGPARILVTTGPRTVPPLKIDFPLVDSFLGQLLPGDQGPFFLGWLKSALAALHRGTFAPGHLLVLAGPPGCGKSLLQNIITEILGGRSAKPYRYMIGQTAFNSELFGAEHLMIEDDASQTDWRSRRQFAAVLKQFLHSETQSFHAKGRDAITLKAFWRITVSVNEEPENLLVLPPLDDDLSGKVMLLKCERPDCLPDAADPAAFIAFRKTLTAELPGLVQFLNGYRIPKALRATTAARRFGLDAYQHPDLSAALTSLTPQARLLGWLDAWGLVTGAGLDGTAEQIENQLRQRDTNREVDRLFNFPSACGTLLGRLRKDAPKRVSSRVLHGKTIWTVTPAPES